MLRNVDVTAKPTIGGMRGKQALIVAFMNPVLRGRTSNNSMALHTVGVSNLASAARHSDDRAGREGMGLPGSRGMRRAEYTAPAGRRKETDGGICAARVGPCDRAFQN